MPPASRRLHAWLGMALQVFSAYWLPALVGLFSLLALLGWENQYPASQGVALGFHVASEPVEPAPQSLDKMRGMPTVERWDTNLSEEPVWAWIPLPSARDATLHVVEFPSRHATATRCWDDSSGVLLGQASRESFTGGMSPSRAGFKLALLPGTTGLLCEATFLGPARFSARLWTQEELATREQEFHRNAGLLDGGMLVLAAFTLIAGFINRDRNYLVFAAWLLVNLRMAALSAGWDQQWLGHNIPVDWLVHLRPVTLALYYLVTFALFTSLFREELERVGNEWVVTLAKWTCVPLLVLSVVLPYGQFLPIIWVTTGLGIAALVYLLGRILMKAPSQVALWYAGSIGIALFASLYEVIAAALGVKGLLGAVNSVTAALASSLLASLAIAAQMRQEHLERLAVQAELQHAYEVIPIGLFTLDLRGRFLSANPALREMLDADVTQPGQDHWQHYFSDTDWSRLSSRTLVGEPVEMELALTHTGHAAKRFLVKAALASDKIEGSLQDITEKALATEHLQFLANHDTLTKVLNRRGIEAMLQSGLNRLGRGRPLAVAYLDLDRFKLINDLYGHTAGDAVLQQVCERAQQPLLPNMHIGRVGGDEFLIVMSDVPLAQAETVCREIVASLSAGAYQVGDRAFHVRGSIGLIEVGVGTSSKDVVSTADRACREAKKGKAGLVVYEQGSRVFTEHEAEMQLVERLATYQTIEGMFLEMQPIMSLHKPHDSLNFEVLLRMHDDQGDRVPTERLIHAGENAGRMGVIDRWVLTTALGWLKQHSDKLGQSQFICMNLSGASLNDELFMEDVFRMLDEAGPVAHRLCLEITESVALHDMGNTRRFIDKVRSYGAKVALDDFGAGYTSFSYLKDLPADILKIDGSFIVNMNRHPANVAIVEAIVSLAQNLGMKTIAEWAEDFETVETLAEIGVDYVQGFVVARPQAPARLLEVTSSADFIQDERLNAYLSDLHTGDDDLANVDLVLGDTAPPPPSTH
jgi:diguanylate cyclase (GGDEF)-like protein